jgi:hypothetical protein
MIDVVVISHLWNLSWNLHGVEVELSWIAQLNFLLCTCCVLENVKIFRVGIEDQNKCILFKKMSWTIQLGRFVIID